jgi:colanic acid biosynthesis glycosyl transferase WcaI
VHLESVGARLVSAKATWLLAAAAITGSRGEIADLVGTHACGAVVEPGDAIALARVIRELSNDPAQCAAMGRRARAMLDAHFTRARALERWRTLIGDIEAGRR